MDAITDGDNRVVNSCMIHRMKRPRDKLTVDPLGLNNFELNCVIYNHNTTPTYITFNCTRLCLFHQIMYTLRL